MTKENNYNYYLPPYGPGWGRGWGMGWRRGWGRGRCFRFPCLPRWWWTDPEYRGYFPDFPSPTKEEEKEILREELDLLKEEMASIKERLEELGKKKK